MKWLIFLALLSVALSMRGLNRGPLGSTVGYNLTNISVPIDHYAPNSPSFLMRYYIRTDYYTSKGSSGPIFFYCGNEGAIEMFVNNSGYIDSLGQQLGAVVVFAEHRYFGGSLPYGNRSFNMNANVKYLSPHQALGDFAYLAAQLQTSYFGAPLIAWGGSYGGMLAAWFRMKYPHLVTGAIAASAPIFHFNGTVDPEEFSQIATYHFSVVGGAECPAVIRTAFAFLESMRYNSSYYFELETVFNTCQEIITSNDVYSIMNWLSNAFTYMAMVDYPSASSFLQPMPANPVSVACGYATQVVDLTDYAEVFAATIQAANVYYNSSGQTTCNDLDLDDAQGSLGDKGWDYLACTTLSMPIGTNGEQDMFWNEPWDQLSYDMQCLQTWGEATQVNYAALWYGNSNNQTYILRHASNIVFSSGSLDPWQSGSVRFNSNPNLIAFVMTGGDHHSDLRLPNVNDPSEVIMGRLIEKQAITYWITGSIE
jgi:lysosomal Pro-X carboxypeptidase